MKILLVTQYFWPENFKVNDLVTGWRERGHEVTVLTGIPNYPGGKPFAGYTCFGPSREEFAGCRVVRVPLVPRGRDSRLRLVANYLSFVASASLFGPLRCPGQFDCLFLYQLSPVTMGLPALLVARLKQLPLALWVQDLWPESLAAVGAVDSDVALKLVGRLSSMIYRRSDLVIAQSSAFIPLLADRRVPAPKIRYLPNWSESHYQPAPAAQVDAVKQQLPRGFVILFAGNLGDAQSLDTTLDAAESLRDQPELHFVFLGDGRRRAWLQEEIERRGLAGTVHWIGQRPAEEMPLWFGAADALLVTLGDGPAMAQTIPGKLQSYFACARPILAALNGAAAQVVRDAEAGLVGPARDVRTLACNALELSQRPAQELDAMGRRGHEYFLEHFDRETLLDRLDGWLEELVREHRTQ